MGDVLLFLFLISFLLLVIGLIKPSVSLFWKKDSTTRKQSLVIYGWSTLVLFVLAAATTEKPDTTANTKINDAPLIYNSADTAGTPVAFVSDEPDTKEKQAQYDAALKGRFEQSFDVLGGYKPLVQQIKSRLADPGVFHYVSTSKKWNEKQYCYVITMKFQVPNVYNFLQTYTAICTAGKMGDLIEVLQYQ